MNQVWGPTEYLFNPGTFGATPQKDKTMTKLMVRIQNDIAAREERGAAMAEYGLLLALVALAAIVVLAAFGENIRDVFQSADTRLETGINAAGGGGTTP